MPDTRAHLHAHRYGKSRVRLLRVTRHDTHHDLDEWTVEILLTGDFPEVFLEGDNTRVLATDTMKNTVYYVARGSSATSPEAFACELIDFLFSRNPQLTFAEATIHTRLWQRLTVAGAPYPTAFQHGSEERRTTHVARALGQPCTITSGLTDLVILKTAQSAFTGFLRDSLTTLPETTDRLLGTSLTAHWPYTPEAIAEGIDFNRVHTHLRQAMLDAFARHDSLSVQQTLFAMAEAALAHNRLFNEIFLRMPNRHNLLADLSRFGRDNPNHIFIPTDDPHGTIEATVRRAV